MKKLISLLFVLSLSLAVASSAMAATFTVDSALDTLDETIGDRACADSGGKCSLRAAIMEANAFPGADTIVLTDDTYRLTLSAMTDDDTAVRGDLDITESVTISGVSGGSTTIDGSDFEDKDGDGYTYRIFQITPAAASVTFSDLTIKGGNVDGSGGGIASEATALTLTNSTVSGNTATSSAAVGGGIATSSTTTLTNSTVTQNTVSSSSSIAYGGGIYASSTVTLTNSTVFGNTVTSSSSPAVGGGIYASSTVTLTDSTVTQNTVSSSSSLAYGGGIYALSSSTLTLTDSTVSENTVTGFSDVYGGGILVYGESSTDTLTMTDSEVKDNTITSSASTGYGGGIYLSSSVSSATASISGSTISGNKIESDDDAKGGGIYIVSHSSDLITLSVSQTTISGNSISGNSPYGGGFFMDNANVKLSESTVSGNSTINPSDPVSGWGGGIYANSSGGLEELIITQSTISNNSVYQGGGGIYAHGGMTLGFYNVTIAGNSATAGSGGGIFCSSAAGIFQNTLFADNSALSSPDCGGTLASGSYNLIEDYDSTACDISGLTNTISDDPLLVALTSNGGSTETQALTVGSAAIDAGNPAGCTDADGNLLTTDQRGYTRDSSCDIGAYEYQVTCGDEIITGTEECDDGNTTAGDGCSATCTTETDTDGDGYYAENDDCDDFDAAINPGATETIDNGTDEDCSGADMTSLDSDDDGDGVADTADADADSDGDGVADTEEDTPEASGSDDKTGGSSSNGGGGCSLNVGTAGGNPALVIWLFAGVVLVVLKKNRVSLG